MLLDHYGLREQPFGVTPNPRYLYLSPTHREALSSLVYGIEAGRGFVSLIAKPGMGKTTLLFQLLERLGTSARTVFLFQTQCDAREFVRSVLTDLGIDAATDDLAGMQARLTSTLIAEMRADRRFVLVIDEAQNLEDSVLEVVRMLSNFETSRAKLMQIVLAGQPQLADKLARPSMVQLRQRVSIVSRLQPLSRVETSEYIDHRLAIAGYHGGSLFTPGARALIASASEGIPRNINNICFNALSLGYATGGRTVDSRVVQEVTADLDLDGMVTSGHGQGTRRIPVAARRGGRPASVEAGVEGGKGGWAVVVDRILSPARRRALAVASAADGDPEPPRHHTIAAGLGAQLQGLRNARPEPFGLDAGEELILAMRRESS
ncbi:MAG TPA: AAA family ATPase [Terriglobia bacterium]|nr:AAA family ATPase [Terriglobia bacterium]